MESGMFCLVFMPKHGQRSMPAVARGEVFQDEKRYLVPSCREGIIQSFILDGVPRGIVGTAEYVLRSTPPYLLYTVYTVLMSGTIYTVR